MTKALWIALALSLLLANAAAAETLTKKGEGVYISDAIKGKIAMKSGRRLVINAASSLAGELVIEAGGNDCRFSYRKILKTTSREEAEEYAAIITVEVETLKDDVILSLRAPAKAPWGGSSNSGRLTIKIFIPDSCAAEINTAYFDISGQGPFTEFLVSESLSKVQVEDVHGLVDIKVSNRPLIIKNVTGKLLASNKYDRLRLENIDTGENVGTIHNEHGEITIDGYRGGLDVRTSYDRIVGQNLYLFGTQNKFRNTSALISLSFDSLTGGNLRINNQYENISLDFKGPVDAEFICKFESGNTVTADHMEILPTLVDENRLEFETGEGTAELRLNARGSGDITISGPRKVNIAGGK
jgi:hypothetical protein